MRMCAVVGSTRLNDPSSALYTIDKIDFHPKYRAPSKRYDIAMLRTRENIVFNEFVQPIALPSQNIVGDVPVTVSGWGTLEVGFEWFLKSFYPVWGGLRRFFTNFCGFFSIVWDLTEFLLILHRIM